MKEIIKYSGIILLLISSIILALIVYNTASYNTSLLISGIFIILGPVVYVLVTKHID